MPKEQDKKIDGSDSAIDAAKIAALHAVKEELEFDEKIAAEASAVNPGFDALDSKLKLAIVSGTVNQVLSLMLKKVGLDKQADQYHFFVSLKAIPISGEPEYRVEKHHPSVQAGNVTVKEHRERFETRLRHQIRRALEAFCREQKIRFSPSVKHLIKKLGSQFSKIYFDERLLSFSPDEEFVVEIRGK